MNISTLDTKHDTIEYDVYRNISNIIFSSLDIEVVLENLSKYLLHFFSHTGISLQITDLDKMEIIVLADTRQGKTKRLHTSFHITTKVEEAIVKSRMVPTPKHFVPQICNNTHQNENLKIFFKNFWSQPVSVILIPLIISKHSYHLLTIYSHECTQYTEANLELCTAIRHPLNLAFSNIIEFEKINEKKKELEEHNVSHFKNLDDELREILNLTFEGIHNQIETLPHIAQTDSTVLILGETGVGKDVFARAIHQLSKRSKKPFVKVNCGAIPDTLIDSALFGHTKGAFTGANSLQVGYFEQAQEGILFLDEIGELPLPVQSRLLQVLQFKEIQRVGSPLTIKLNIRIVAATHRDLQAMVREGTFREDLWYRLNIIPIFIPPLRERRNDIPDLIKLITKKKCRDLGITTIPRLSKENLESLDNYPWYGNIRELENLIERTLILNPYSNIISLVPQNQFTTPSSNQENSSPSKEFSHKETSHHIDLLDNVISSHIAFTLKHTHGKIKGKNGAAELLGLPPSTLRSKMKKLNIPHPDFID